MLDKLTNGRPINSLEKRVMAFYLEMFMVRDREKRKELKRNHLGDRNKIENALDAIMESARGTRSHTEYTDHKLDYIEHYETRTDQVFSDTWVPSNFIRWLFFHMTWRVAESEVVDFVIGEPPLALAGTGIGLGHPDAEVFFPLSSRHILHMSWVGDPAVTEKVIIPPLAARQANKIFISTSARFVFFDKKCPKMLKLIKKKKFHNNEVNLNWSMSGVNPYRPKQPLKFSDEDMDKLAENICMHPAASNFKHAWVKEEDHHVIEGGRLAKWCKYCGMMELKYGDNLGSVICNNEVRMATGGLGPYRNWWMKSAPAGKR